MQQKGVNIPKNLTVFFKEENKMKIESLKKKTIFLVIIITFLCAAGSAFIASQVVEKQMMNKYDSDKKTSIETLSYSLSPMLNLYDFKQVEQLIKTSISYAEIASVAVFDHNGTLIKSATEQRGYEEDLDMEKRKITTSLGGIIGSLEIGFSKEYIHNRIRTMVLSLVFGMIGIFVLIALGLYAFMKHSIVEPLETFANTIKKMTFDNFSSRVKIYRNDEIGTLAASFNRMADSLEESHEALRESEDRFRTIFNAVNDAVFVHDMETGAILDVNDTMCEMYGYAHEEARQLNIEDLVPSEPPYIQQDAHAWIKKTAGGEPQIFEWRARRKSGDVFWAEVSMRCAKIISRDCLLFVVRNISERKKVEEELNKYREHLEELVKERTAELEKSISLMSATIESTADGILATDIDGRVTACNNKFAELCHLPDEIIESKDDKKLLKCMVDQIDNPQALLMRVEELYSQPEQEDFDVLKFKDGRILERYSLPQRLGDSVIGRVWSFRDVTKRKRAEKALKESEERLKLALKGGDLGFWDVNLQTEVTIFNERYATMLGYELNELQKSREQWIKVLHPDDRERILKVGEDYRNGRIPDYEVEYRAVTKTGTVIWQASKGAMVESDESGDPLRMIGTVQDITKRKQAEDELRNRTEELEMFNKAMVDREMRIIEMKQEVNRLCNELGRDAIYSTLHEE
jgi:PAS domain S-box-containing protein